MNSPTQNRKKGLPVYEVVVFAFLGVLMLASKLVMEVLPNIHLLGLFIVCFTVVYRVKALFPIYVYIFLQGVVSGFAPWWVPYLYIWLPLWGVAMLLPRSMPKKIAPVVYMAVCATHGFLYGVLYAPAQAVLFGHTHQDLCRQEDGMWVVNPGSCGYYGGSAALITVANGKISDCRILRQSDMVL